MLNKLKGITQSQKLRIVVLFAVMALVAAVVVFAFDGAYGYQDQDYESGYGYYGYYSDYAAPVYYEGYAADYYYYDYETYDIAYVVPFYTSWGVEYQDLYYLEAYMYEMAGYAGEAPVMMYDPYD